MVLFPNCHLNRATDITIELLQENHIKGLILDVDNTLIDFDKKMLDGIENWCNDLKQKGIKFYIVSNSNKKEKVKMVAKKMRIPYLFFAMKPFKRGFKKARNHMKLESKNIAVVGDQIFTDVLGANRCNMFSILVNPIAEKDIFITVVKRPLEKYILNSYHKKQEKGK